MSAEARHIRYVYLIGHGISYSRSPAMHNAAFEALGMSWRYELLDVDEGGLAGAIGRLREQDVAGANVTIPHKQAVMASLDGVTADAVRARAVNTIVNDAGTLRGANTDIAAIQMAVEETGIVPAEANAVILGAGGAARAAAAALEGARVTFVARRAGVDLPGTVVSWSDPSVPALTRAADLVVNATPLGRHGEMPFRPAALPRTGAVIDLVYVTGGTPLIRKARSLGLPAVDGWEILLQQGAISFLQWTGRAAPLDAMRQTLAP